MLKKAFILAFFTIYVNSFPYSNQVCSVFQYSSHNGIKIGRVEFNNDRSGTYRLSVNMSAPSYSDQSGNIKLELRTATNDIIKGNSLVYFIYFPSQTHLPKPTRIEFNGRVYCNNPVEEVKPGSGITNFWASTYIGTGGGGGVHYKPEPYPYPQPEYRPPTEVVNNNNNPPFIDILHIETPPIENNKINTQHVISVQPTTPRNSDSPYTTYKSVKVVSNNSTLDCVNTTMVEDGPPQSNNQNSWSSGVIPTRFKNSSYSYKCKEIHVTNQHIHTVSVTKS